MADLLLPCCGCANPRHFRNVALVVGYAYRLSVGAGLFTNLFFGLVVKTHERGNGYELFFVGLGGPLNSGGQFFFPFFFHFFCEVSSEGKREV